MLPIHCARLLPSPFPIRTVESLVHSALQRLRNAIPNADTWKALWDSFLLAAPKKKRSKRVRRQIMQNLIPKNLKNIVQCPICDNHKLANNICPNCLQKYYEYVAERKKEENKAL